MEDSVLTWYGEHEKLENARCKFMLTSAIHTSFDRDPDRQSEKRGRAKGTGIIQQEIPPPGGCRPKRARCPRVSGRG